MRRVMHVCLCPPTRGECARNCDRATGFPPTPGNPRELSHLGTSFALLPRLLDSPRVIARADIFLCRPLPRDFHRRMTLT